MRRESTVVPAPRSIGSRAITTLDFARAETCSAAARSSILSLLLRTAAPATHVLRKSRRVVPSLFFISAPSGDGCRDRLPNPLHTPNRVAIAVTSGTGPWPTTYQAAAQCPAPVRGVTARHLPILDTPRFAPDSVL